MIEYLTIHADQVRLFNAVMNLINLFMIGLWIWLFSRNKRLRKDYNQLNLRVDKNKHLLEKMVEGNKRSSELLEQRVLPAKVYLVWKINHDLQNEKPDALIGCYRSEEVAQDNVGNNFHLIQEIEVL